MVVRWIRPVAAALVAGFVAVAASAVPAAAKPARESCGLLRTGEVTHALEQPSVGPAPGAAPLVCDWTLEPTDTRPAGAVSVYLRRGDDARDAFTLARKFFAQDGAVVRVPKLGERAFYVPVAGVVYVLEDSDTLLSLQGVYPTGSAVDAAGLQQALTALAAAAARRL
jgi:hypothetical protein